MRAAWHDGPANRLRLAPEVFIEEKRPGHTPATLDRYRRVP